MLCEITIDGKDVQQSGQAQVVIIKAHYRSKMDSKLKNKTWEKWSDGKPTQPKPKPSSKICPEKLSTDFDFLLQSGQFSDVTIRLSRKFGALIFSYKFIIPFSDAIFWLVKRFYSKTITHRSILTIPLTPGVRTIYSAVTKSSWGRGAQSSMQCSFTIWRRGLFK